MRDDLDTKIREAAVTAAKKNVAQSRTRVEYTQKYMTESREHFNKAQEELTQDERALTLAKLDLVKHKND